VKKNLINNLKRVNTMYQEKKNNNILEHDYYCYTCDMQFSSRTSHIRHKKQGHAVSAFCNKLRRTKHLR